MQYYLWLNCTFVFQPGCFYLLCLHNVPPDPSLSSAGRLYYALWQPARAAESLSSQSGRRSLIPNPCSSLTARSLHCLYNKASGDINWETQIQNKIIDDNWELTENVSSAGGNFLKSALMNNVFTNSVYSACLHTHVWGWHFCELSTPASYHRWPGGDGCLCTNIDCC